MIAEIPEILRRCGVKTEFRCSQNLQAAVSSGQILEAQEFNQLKGGALMDHPIQTPVNDIMN